MIRYVLFAIVLFLISAYFGKNIRFADQWPLYESLRTTAGIIFGVMGVWIALIYPDAMSKILDKKTADKKVEFEKVKKVLQPLVTASFILIIVLIVGLLAPIFKQINFFMDYVECLRVMSFFVLLVCSTIMIWLLIKVLIPGVEIKIEIEAIQKKAHVIKEYRKHTQSNQTKKH